MPKNQEQLDLLSFQGCFGVFLTAVVAFIQWLYTVEWAWLEDAESLECMQRYVGLLCQLVSM